MRPSHPPRRCLLVTTLLCGGILTAQTPLPLWEDQDIPPAGMPNAAASPETARDGRVFNVSNPELFYYAAISSTNPTTAVVIVPGGGYRRLALEKEGHAVGRWLAEAGLHAFVLKYRVGEAKHPAAFRDARQAVTVVRQQMRKVTDSPILVGLMGFSAGGHLAALVANRPNQPDWPVSSRRDDADCRPDFTVLVYPVIHFDGPDAHHNSAAALLGAEHPDPGLFSVDHLVSAGTPPALLIHAEDDPAVPITHAVAYRDALIRVGAPVDLLLLPRGGHGFGLGDQATGTHLWQDEALRWMRTIPRGLVQDR